MALLGVDVSRHQGTINWTQVRSIGTVFAFCKATDGTSYAHTGYFHQQLPLIRANGMIPGAYHWLKAGQNPVQQARYFVQTIGDVDGLLCALDVEEGSVHEARAFAQEFARLTGGHPLFLYTGRWYWVGTIGNPFGADIGPLWHSEYETTDAEIADGPELDIYGGWSGATMWQYTSSGSVPGVNGSCDRNLFYGTHAELLALAGASSTPSPPRPTAKDQDMLFIFHPRGAQSFVVSDNGFEPVSGDCFTRASALGLALAPEEADADAILRLSMKGGNVTIDQAALDEAIDKAMQDVIEDAVREVFADAGQE